MGLVKIKRSHTRHIVYLNFKASFRTFSYFQKYKEQQFGHNLSNFANECLSQNICFPDSCFKLMLGNVCILVVYLLMYPFSWEQTSCPKYTFLTMSYQKCLWLQNSVQNQTIFRNCFYCLHAKHISIQIPSCLKICKISLPVCCLYTAIHRLSNFWWYIGQSLLLLFS